MTAPLANAVFVASIGQSNNANMTPATEWPIASRGAQAVGYCQYLVYPVGFHPTIQPALIQSAWHDIAPYIPEGGSLSCTWHMPLATALISAGIQVNIAHYAWSGRALAWFIPGATGTGWPDIRDWFLARYLECASPTCVIVQCYQGEAGVSDGNSQYSGTWDVGFAEIMSGFRATLSERARGVIVALPPGEQQSPEGIVEAQYLASRNDFRLRTVIDTEATFQDGIHIDAASGVHLSGLVSNAIVDLTRAYPRRRI